MVGSWGYWIVLLHHHKPHQINLCIKKRLENIIFCKENKIVSVNYPYASIDLTLSFLCGICDILEHEGPLFETRTSHVLAGNLKCAAHAFFKFSSDRSPYSKFTKSLGCNGLKICLLSGSEASRWTMFSCRALDDPFLFLRADIASTRVLLPLICVCRRSQVACVLLVLFRKIESAAHGERQKNRQRHILLCRPSAAQRYLGLWKWWATLQHVIFSSKMSNFYFTFQKKLF